MQTKRNLRLLSVLLTVILCVTMLTACGGSKLNGTYHYITLKVLFPNRLPLTETR